MDADKVVEFAPYILVAYMFFWKNNVFVRQEQLEKMRREITECLEKKFQDKYVELNAYKEFQNRVFNELADIKELIINGGRRRDDA